MKSTLRCFGRGFPLLNLNNLRECILLSFVFSFLFLLPFAGNTQVTLSVNGTQCSNDIKINFSGDNSGNPSTSWIGLFKPGAAHTSYLIWQYSNATQGTASFIDRNVTPGTYEARYFYNNGYVLQAKTTFEVVADCSSANSCDTQLAYWNLNACHAVLGSTNQNYDEFTATVNKGGCASVTASNVHRTSPGTNTHSCTPGVNGTRGLCVNYRKTCSFNDNAGKAVKFSVSLNPASGEQAVLGKLEFYENAPVNFQYIGGASGPNNYPTKYGIRVTKNGEEIYKETDIATTTSYSLESFDFSNDPDFTVTTATTFEFELLAYCQVGNGASVFVWDLDDIKVFGCCGSPSELCANQGGDNDGDGICANDDCDDNDANIGAKKTPGTACNDGNSNTENDVIQSDGCTCKGTPATAPCDFDNDNDGIAAEDDCDDNNAALPGTPGTACNDGNSNTINDVIQSDGCTCAGISDCPTGPRCTTYTVRNATACGGSVSFAVFIEEGGGAQQQKPLQNGKFVECGNSGTLTGYVAGYGNLEVQFTGKSSSNNYSISGCSNVGTIGGLHSYSGFSGTLGGRTLTQRGARAAIGVGATRVPGVYGIGGWFHLSNGQVGDFNVQLSNPVQDVCCENPPKVYIGNDDVVCEGETVSLSASVEGGATSVTAWKALSGGDGTFSSTQGLNVTYTPGPNDLANGSVRIRATTNTVTNCGYARDFKTIYFCDCSCDNVTDGGKIGEDESKCGSYDPARISNVQSPSGGSGAIEYLWLSSTTGCPTELSQAIPGATGASYNPGPITQTTWYVRCSRREGCDDWMAGESNCIKKEVTGQTPGTSCDDGDPNTENDVIQSDGCTCKGTPVGPCYNKGGDSDNDGICAEDDCDDNDANVGAKQTPGTACNDGNSNTINDVIQSDGCTCTGTSVGPCYYKGGDSDGDGVCADDDCDDNDASIGVKQTPGTYCNDGDLNTEDDIIQSDGCTCAGTPVNPNTCDVTIDVDGDKITINNITGAITAVKVLTQSYATIFECSDWTTPCNVMEMVTVPGPGTYFVQVQTYADWSTPICDLFETVVVTGGDPCAAKGGDNDNDGVCAQDDCDDNDASVGGVGSSCDDGNPNTVNDKYDADCKCVGTPNNNICDVTVEVNGDEIKISNIVAPITSVQVIDAGWNVVFECNDWTTPCNAMETVSGLADGTYFVQVKTYADWSTPICDIFETVVVGDGPPPPGPCSITATVSNIVCNSEGTTDPSDDTYCFDVTADIVNDGGWGFTVVGTNVHQAPNGSTATVCGLLISEGVKVFTVRDSDKADCTTTIRVVPPAPCSGSDPCVDKGGDADGDGVCADDDCDDNNANISHPGDSCDDGNPNTNNDVIQSDCTCAGTPVSTTCNVSISVSGNTVTVSGLTDAITSVKIIDQSWNTVASCDDWTTACSATEVFSGLASGTYFVQVKTYADWSTPVCDLFETVTVGGTNPCAGHGGDADGDGVCANTDCDDNDANIGGPGSSCDDGDAGTINDVLDANCNCAGTPNNNTCDAEITVNGSKITVSNIGGEIRAVKFLSSTWEILQSCDDWTDACGDMEMFTAPSAGTYYVQVQTYADWSTPICDLFETVTITGNPDPCADEGGDSDGDGVCDNQDCDDNNPNISHPGDSCDDGDPNTENDVIQQNCTCVGTPVSTCDNVTNGGTIQGDESKCGSYDPSRITNATLPSGGSGTIEYIWLSSTTGCPTNLSQRIPGATGRTYNPGVITQTTYYRRCARRAGCTEDTDWMSGESNCIVKTVTSQTPGTSCDDGDSNTINDVIQSDGCTCAGVPKTCDDSYPSGTKYVYKVTDSDPVCSIFNGFGAGIIFQKNTASESYKVWEAGADLIFIEYHNNTAELKGSVIKRSNGEVGQLHIQFFDYVANGTSDWQQSCYVSNTGSFVNYHYNGTLTAPSGTYTMHNYNSSAYANVGQGVSNTAGSGYGFGAWPRGTIGGQAEMFGNLERIYSDYDGDGICSDDDCDDYDANIGYCPSTGTNRTQILGLDATAVKGEVDLTWSNNTGDLNDDFEIQRSEDGVNFETIGLQNSLDDGSRMKFYGARDRHPLTGANFYRVRLNYSDGTFEYSEVRRVTISDIEDFGLFPNPAHETVNVSLKGYEGSDIEIQLIDGFGKRIKAISLNDVSDTSYSVDLTTVQNGIYSIWIFTDGRKPIGKKMIVNKMY